MLGHPWVFRGEFTGIPDDLAQGEIVQVVDHRGRPVGAGYSNPASQITVRLLTRGRFLPDREWARERLSAAVEFRRALLPNETDLRLVHAEADFLPGLVVERMGGYIVVSPDTYGAEHVLLPWLLSDLESLASKGVLLRATSPVRVHEGLGTVVEMLAGEPPEGPITVREGEVVYELDLMLGQKTGHYFDQRANRMLAASMSSGLRALDVFSYTGGFALQMARMGAVVTAVDSSEEAIRLLGENARRNSVQVQGIVANAFDHLRSAVRAGDEYDLVVLDPPPFARGRQHLPAALRAYKEINLRALRLLKPGGYLFTASCSHAVSLDDFLGVVRSAAQDAQVAARLLEVRGPDRDHPVRLEVPETDYLHLLVLERL